MSALESLPGIGPVCVRRLSDAGIKTAEQLCEAGAKTAFLRLKSAHPDACLSSLYAIAGAIRGVPRGKLDAEEKAELRSFFRSLQTGSQK